MLPVFFIVVNQVLNFEAHSRLNFPVLPFFEHSLQALVEVFQINHLLSFKAEFLHVHFLLLIFMWLLILSSIFSFLLSLVTTLIDLVRSQSFKHVTQNLDILVV